MINYDFLIKLPQHNFSAKDSSVSVTTFFGLVIVDFIIEKNVFFLGCLILC
jgi:hypothetical protein